MSVKLLIVALSALIVGTIAERFNFNDPNMPIRVVETSRGVGNRVRITHIEAHILSRHIRRNNRVNFRRSGNIEAYYQGIRAPGDERGHLVAAQFSGPPEWFNLSPQSPRVNRNRGYQSITTDWFGAECEVRRWLEGGRNREVHWIVDMVYIEASNRPHQYHLRARLCTSRRVVRSIDTWIQNSFLGQDSTFWICRRCRSNNHRHDELRRRRDSEQCERE